MDFLDFWIVFQARRTLVCFSYFVDGPVVKIKAQAAARVGRSGISDVDETKVEGFKFSLAYNPEESAGRPPAA